MSLISNRTIVAKEKAHADLISVGFSTTVMRVRID